MKKISYIIPVMVVFIASISRASDSRTDNERSFQQIVNDELILIERQLGLNEESIRVDIKGMQGFIFFNKKKQERDLKNEISLAKAQLKRARGLYTHEEKQREIAELKYHANQHKSHWNRAQGRIGLVLSRTSISVEVKSERIKKAESRVTAAKKAFTEWEQKQADKESQLEFIKTILQKELDLAKEELAGDFLRFPKGALKVDICLPSFK